MQNPPESATARSVDQRLALVSTLVIVDSMHFVFARLLLPHISPNVSAMYVLGIGTLQVGLFGLWRGQLRWRILGDNLLFFLSIGLLIGVSTYLNYAAVGFIDAGTASMLGKLTTLFSIGFGVVWLGDRLTPIQIGGAVLAILGSFTIAFQPGNVAQLGSILIIMSTFMYALHAAIVKRYGGEIEFVNFFFYRLLCTTGVLFLLAIARGALEWPSQTAWLLLLLVATVDVVISRVLYYTALRRLQMSLHAIILMLSPVAAVLWSLLLFGTLPNLQQAAGGVAVLAGVLIVTLSQPALRARRRAAQAPVPRTQA
jgi:O-acetylserine/cysteine efflux transporter